MSPVLWTRAELETATGGHFAGSEGSDVTGISIDTRTLQPGDLFIALKGDSSDGHAHVATALEKGAAAVLVHEAPAIQDGRLLVVGDTLLALQDLARARRAQFTGRLIAVTGSVGKTTTKDMLATALSASGRVHAAVASYNNHWGVPLTLARMPRDAEWCISEIGMNHSGEITPLAAMCQPHVAVITTIGSAHIGHMGSIAAIAEEKACLIAQLQPNGIAVVPDDAKGQACFEAAAKTSGAILWKCGEQPDSTARLLDLVQTDIGSNFMAAINGTTFPIHLSVPGKHLARNALSALAAIIAAGGDGERATQALGTFRPGNGRGARREILGGSVTLLDESYNASVPAILAALEVLRITQAKRRIAVLGDMRELGDFSASEHLSLLAPVSETADLVFCCGPNMKLLFDALPPSLQGGWAPTSAELAPAVRASLHAGDAVLVKGSLGSAMRTIVSVLDQTGDTP